MAKRAALNLSGFEEKPAAPAAAPTASGASGAPEPITTIYGRIPWSLGEQLRDLAREHSRASGRRVTVNELVEEAIRKLLAEQAS